MIDMTCPDQENLLSAALGDPDAAELSDHLQQCPLCQDTVSRMRKAVSHLRQTSFGSDPVPCPSNEPAAEATDFPSGFPMVFPASAGGDRPTALGKYLIIGELGRGGQARVYRALHPTLNRDVAIKWSHRSVTDDPTERDRFAREGKLLADLDHPGIVRVYDLDVQDQRPFMVMEFVRGCDLSQYAAREKVTPAQAAGLVAELARAVAVAHRRGIIHQDIKPANVLMDESGRPRLSDFGIARLGDLWSSKDEQPVGGTLAYMAPEQLDRTREPGPAVDVYTLGGVLFFLLTGKTPRRLPDNPALAWQQVAAGDIDWTPLEEKNVPRRLANICRHALARAPEDRPGAQQLADDLDRFLRRPQIIRWTVAAVAACLALVALTWGIGLYSLLKPAPPNRIDSVDAQPLTLLLVRDGQRTWLKSQDDWERVLPLRTQDKVKLAGTLPAEMNVGLFVVTLSDLPALKVTPLAPVVVSGHQFRLEGVAPLEGSPATELLLACGSTGGVPSAEDVAALLRSLPSIAAPLKGTWKLPDNLVVSFEQNKMNESKFLARVGKVEQDPINQSIQGLDEVRRKLRERYEFVAGLVFTHVPREAEGPAKRSETGSIKSRPVSQQAGGSPDDRKLFHEVMDRLLQTDLVRQHYPADAVWPPSVFIQPRSAKVFNAFAGPMGRDLASNKQLIRAFITEGYMDKVIDGDAEILAAIMGHELAHVTRGHLSNKITGDLSGLSFNRAQEFEADLEGVKIAVAAGFSYRSGVKSAFREWKVLGDRSGFEAGSSTHPSWADRLAILDKKQPEI